MYQFVGDHGNSELWVLIIRSIEQVQAHMLVGQTARTLLIINGHISRAVGMGSLLAILWISLDVWY